MCGQKPSDYFKIELKTFSKGSNKRNQKLAHNLVMVDIAFRRKYKISPNVHYTLLLYSLYIALNFLPEISSWNFNSNNLPLGSLI